MKTMEKDDYLLIETRSKYFQDTDIFMQKCFTHNKYSISILYYLQGLVNSTECVHNWNRIGETRSLHFLKFRKHYKTEFRISAWKVSNLNCGICAINDNIHWACILLYYAL